MRGMLFGAAFGYALTSGAPGVVSALSHSQDASDSGAAAQAEQGAERAAPAVGVSSSPADGAVLAAAPSRLTLNFAEPVLLDSVSAKGPDAAPVRVSFKRTAAPLQAHAVELHEALAPGHYAVSWKAKLKGEDVKGALRFAVHGRSDSA